jgi:hypothetical protein
MQAARSQWGRRPKAFTRVNTDDPCANDARASLPEVRAPRAAQMVISHHVSVENADNI